MSNKFFVLRPHSPIRLAVVLQEFSPDVRAGVAGGVRPSPGAAIFNSQAVWNCRKPSVVSSLLRPGTDALRSPIRLFVVLQKFPPDVFAGIEAGGVWPSPATATSELASRLRFFENVRRQQIAAPDDGRSNVPFASGLKFLGAFGRKFIAAPGDGRHSVNQADTAVRSCPGNARCSRAILCWKPPDPPSLDFVRYIFSFAARAPRRA